MAREVDELRQLRDEKLENGSDRKPNLVDHVKRRIYILQWLPSYGKEDLISDIIAGVTLGLTIIPQSIAYAAIAGVPSQYGLYAAFMGSLVYILFGTVKEVSIGPTSLMSILTVQYTADKPVQYVIILASLAGVVELLMGVLKLGFLVSFIPIPVTSAFTSATSIIIIGTQLKNLLGISVSGKGFFDTIYALSGKLTEFSTGDLVLGLVGCVFLLSLKQIVQIPVNEGTKTGRFLKKLLWYVSLARNALIVLISSVVAYQWSGSGAEVPFKLSGHVKQGIPSFEFPVYSVESGNSTISYFEVVKELGSSIIVIPLVAVLANVSIAKAFSAGKIVDASQEMIALGLCNILGSCFSSMPTCGAFTRSAVSHSSGVRTPLAGLYSAVITLLALSLLTPYFYYIPKTTLAAVLICSVMFMIDFKIVDTLRQSSKIDTIAWFGCFSCSLLLGVEIGLLFGVLICILGLLKVWVRPTIHQSSVEQAGFRYVKLSPEAGLFFPAVDFLRTQVLKVAIAQQVPVVVDCTAVIGLDHTSSKGLRELAKELDKVKQKLVLLNLQPALKAQLKESETDKTFSFWDDEGDVGQSNVVQSVRL